MGAKNLFAATERARVPRALSGMMSGSAFFVSGRCRGLVHFFCVSFGGQSYRAMRTTLRLRWIMAQTLCVIFGVQRECVDDVVDQVLRRSWRPLVVLMNAMFVAFGT